MQDILRRIPYYGFWALLIYMPFHIFLSQWLSLLTGGLDAWKIGKDVVLAGLVVFTICLVFWNRRGGVPRAWWVLLGLAGAYGALHLVLWAGHSNLYTDGAILGIIYNNRLPALALLGYGAYLLWPARFIFSSVIKIILIVSTLVAFLGVLQYLLPKDLLTHFGYSLERGARPAFFIDDHAGLPRVMSTLREPNALGAYLLLPIAALVTLLCRFRDSARRFMLAGSLCLHLSAVFLTQSRSAWLATMAVVAFVLLWQYRSRLGQLARRWWPVMVGVIVILALAGWTQRNNVFFQQYIVHSNPTEEVEDLDSNDYHWMLLRQGVEGVTDQPLGHGPGTAGLVSIQNPGGGQLTENYYVQIGYEVGVVGLLLFLVLNIWLFIRLWRRHDTFGLILCASFAGYVVTNMLLHSWSNEAVATQWWLLAGLALALPASQPNQ